MEDKVRCQSCGMPIDASFNNLGTDTVCNRVSEYCLFCFKDGEFTNPDQTVDGMVQTSIDFMTRNLGFTREQATEMSNDVIRKLNRWN